MATPLMVSTKDDISKPSTVVFERGRYQVIKHVSIKCNAPKPLFIVTPVQEGNYPVVLFLHGYNIWPSCYNNLLEHISSHGYIIVAPQPDINSAAEVTNWMCSGLKPPLLPENVTPNLSKFALAGHGRGAYLAFALALGKAKICLNLKLLTLIGIYPVAGPSKCLQVYPRILTQVSHSFNLDIPAMVIGTGLGGERRSSMPCNSAPDGVNYVEFFRECKAGRYRRGFIIPDYGHLDMLDDDHTNCIGRSIKGIMGIPSKSGKCDKKLMMECVGGLVVAMLLAKLELRTVDMEAIVDEPGIAPVKLKLLEY